MKKQYCGQCIHFRYEDSDGLGWCELWETADTSCEDEACVEFEKDKVEDMEYE